MNSKRIIQKVLKTTVALASVAPTSMKMVLLNWRRIKMESTYKIITLVGSSPTSWEDAMKSAIADAGKTLRNLRIATVDELDCKMEDGKIVAYRVRFRLSFKYEGE